MKDQTSKYHIATVPRDTVTTATVHFLDSIGGFCSDVIWGTENLRGLGAVLLIIIGKLFTDGNYIGSGAAGPSPVGGMGTASAVDGGRRRLRDVAGGGGAEGRRVPRVTRSGE